MSKAVRILLIEDDPNLGYVIEENLQDHGFSVTRCGDGEEGKLAFFRSRPDLCLLDVMLPEKDGFSLARDIREVDQQTPIIFLTAKSLKEDRIAGFKIGGDDYVTKPFSMEELVLRIGAVLKRSHGLQADEQANSFKIGSFTFDFGKQILTGDQSSRKLTAKEAELLKLLCTHQNKLLERQLALQLIWGEDTFFNARSMDVFISRLRKYLNTDPKIEIVNVHGRGFKLLVSR